MLRVQVLNSHSRDSLRTVTELQMVTTTIQDCLVYNGRLLSDFLSAYNYVELLMLNIFLLILLEY